MSRRVMILPDSVGRFSCSRKRSRPLASVNGRSPAGAPGSQGGGPWLNWPGRPSGRLVKRNSPSSPSTQMANGTVSSTVCSSFWIRPSWPWRDW